MPHPVDIAVGKKIRIRRIQVGMSQTKLGDQLGVTFQQIQKYERGANRVSCSRLVEIAKALDVPTGYFFDERATHAKVRSDITLDFLATKDGQRLASAMMKLPPALQHKLVGLVEGMEALA
jgi:transcriptional regulator with XRE-family HTH domain